MRLKTSTVRDREHSALCSALIWISADEVVSAADDHQVISWNLVSGSSTKMADLGNVTPTHMHISTSGSRDVAVVSSAEGRLLLLSRSGHRVEKSVEAHHGACLIAQWSPDNSSIVSGGEDGSIKIWSKSLLLRNTLVQTTTPVHALAWSSDGQHLVYASDGLLTVHSLQPALKSRPLQWKAHDGLILCVDWSKAGRRIVSGSEDCRYKIWDEFGRQLYVSSAHDSPITSCTWAPSGQLLAIGGFNTLRLCDVLGWSHSLAKPRVGSLLQISWSGDSTQVAVACGSGHVLFAHVVDRRLEWANHEVVISGRKSARVHNVMDGSRESLEFRDRIILAELGHQHLVVVTTAQVYMYSIHNWNTPTIMELKSAPIALRLAKMHFLLITVDGLQIFAYDSRLISLLKNVYVRTDSLSPLSLSLSNDCLALIDGKNSQRVHLFDVNLGKALNDNRAWVHRQEVLEVALDQTGAANQRKMAIVDRNQDLYLTQVIRFGNQGNRKANMTGNIQDGGSSSSSMSSGKIASMVESLLWSSDVNILMTIQDGKLCLHTCPIAVFVDRNLLTQTLFIVESSKEFVGASLISWLDNVVTVRKSDGSLVSYSLPPYASKIHQMANSGHWMQTIQLARFVNEISIWACVAALALEAKHLETAEIAFAALQQPDKVYYLRYIRELPSKEIREAELSLLKNQYEDAENLLLQNKRLFRAILLNIHRHNWERAMQLALKHNVHIDTVLAYRAKYLSRHDNRSETLKLFVDAAKDIEVNFESVAATIERELDNERALSEHKGPRRASHIEIM